MSGSLGGGKSKSSQSAEAFQRSEQSSGSVGTSSQSIAFEPFFRQLYGKAAGVADTEINSSVLQTAARDLFTGGGDFLASLNSDQGSDYLQERLTGENPALEAQIDQLREDTGRFFREEINPQITSAAVSGGTLGGSRQGVAQALGAREAGDVFARGVTELRGGDIARRDSVAQSIAQNTIQSANTGLGALPSLLSVLQTGETDDLNILERLGKRD